MIPGLTEAERASLVRRGVMKYGPDMEKVNRFLVWKESEHTMSCSTGGPSIPVGEEDGWIILYPSGRMRVRR